MIYFRLIITMILWGATFIAAKSITYEVDAYNAAFLRFAIASIFLIIFTIKKEGHIPKINLEQFFYLMILGLTGVFAYNVFFF